MKNKGFENLDVYRLADQLADAVWSLVVNWEPFARRALGSQLVRCADSIGANIAEGTGRGSYNDNRRFARVARGSLNEVRHFLRRAFQRGLMNEQQIAQLQPIVRELGPRLNAYIRSIGVRRSSQEPASDQ